MASVTKTIDVCDRCPFEKARPATKTRPFSTGDEYFELKLCDQHASMFDRDMGVWTRLARQVDAPATTHGRSAFFTEEVRANTRRLRELAERARSEQARKSFVAARAQQIDAESRTSQAAADTTAWRSIPGAMTWKLTDHAHDRAEQRGFSLTEVFTAAAQPHLTYAQPWRGPHVFIHENGPCRVIVDEREKAIITVMDRTAEMHTNTPERAAQ